MGARQEELRGRLAAIGFDEVRFVALGRPPGGEGLRNWLEAGHHADMAWMERTAEKRMDPGLVLEGVRSAILLGVDYYQGERPPASARTPAWATYSLYKDYHEKIKPALVRAGELIEEVYGAAPEDYRYYVDTGPVLERAWAALSGVGFIGKNSMLISRTHGNWLFLASILTRLDLESDPPLRGRGDPGADRAIVRQVHALHGRVPHAGVPEAGSRGRPPLHLLPDDREQGGHPRGTACGDRQPGLRLRHLPGCLPVEPLREGGEEHDPVLEGRHRGYPHSRAPGDGPWEVCRGLPGNADQAGEAGGPHSKRLHCRRQFGRRHAP